jgi:hypothetical protein
VEGVGLDGGLHPRGGRGGWTWGLLLPPPPQPGLARPSHAPVAACPSHRLPLLPPAAAPSPHLCGCRGLARGRFTGSLPEAWGGLPGLEVLWLGENRLGGTLPSWAGKGMARLQYLTVDRNDISGGRLGGRGCGKSSGWACGLAEGREPWVIASAAAGPPSLGSTSCHVTPPRQRHRRQHPSVLGHPAAACRVLLGRRQPKPRGLPAAVLVSAGAARSGASRCCQPWVVPWILFDPLPRPGRWT